MKTGIIVLGHDSNSRQCRNIIDRTCEDLRKDGFRNVSPAFHFGEPRSDSVIRSMFTDHGIDTFCILPITVSEGNMTIWNMPKQLGLPDNSGSWMMIGKHDVATRFATAMGTSDIMAEAIIRRMGVPKDDTGIIVLTHGSELSLSEKTAEFYSACLTESGWKSCCAYSRKGPTDIVEAAYELKDRGCKRFRVLPLSVTTDGRYFLESVRRLESAGANYEVLEPVSSYPEFYEILRTKIPEDW